MRAGDKLPARKEQEDLVLCAEGRGKETGDGDEAEKGGISSQSVWVELQGAQRNRYRKEVVLKKAWETWCQKHIESVTMREKPRCSLGIKPRNVILFQLCRHLCGDTLKGKFLDNPNSPYGKSTQILRSLHVSQTTVF